MINVNELMIDNWVRDPDNGFAMQVNAIDTNMKQVSCLVVQADYDTWEYEYDKLNPIPLDPTILEKTPFGTKDFMEVSYCFFITKEGDTFYLQTEYEAIGQAQQTELPELKYLHQLQNLYFALTGQPLKIEL